MTRSLRSVLGHLDLEGTSAFTWSCDVPQHGIKMIKGELFGQKGKGT